MRPSFTSSCSVRSVASQRRCFLIDSLLEERQKRLAATVAAKYGTNAFNPPEEPKREREEIGKETMPELNLEDKGPIIGTKNDGTEGEETVSEEVLPTFEEEKETNTSGRTDRTDQRVGPAGIGNDHHSKALLEALNKLVPVAVRQGAQQTERQPDRGAGESAEGRESGEGSETEKGQAAELLYKLHLFQQQLASSAAASVPWPFVPPGHSPIPTNFFRLPLFPASSFSLPTNPSNNRMPKCFYSPSNPWRHLMPTTSMATSVKCRIKAPNRQNINGTSGTSGMNSAQMDSTNYSSEWTMPNFFNGGPASAVLATIGAFRAAAAASAQNHGTNGAETALTNNKNGNKIGRRSSTTARQQQRHATNGNRNTRSSNAKKYRCDICDKTFSRSNTLITHKRIHTGEKPFRCEHCGRAFRQPGNLTRHAYTHTTAHLRVHSTAAAGTKLGENGGGSASRQCKRCETNFATRAELRAHRCQ